ncbi:YdeI/OmpD-associated family protein [Lewinella sp. IMCC34191]|uniref:YdeI/OmpD-associated family protein n=1 Tax=Lewinella sp. IMCC34191 TaxID=2259172 RepID=UPI000E2298C6|nr:YdeI/OmpD-associated family protein [Lewinella sp. IMCC34191]
MPTLTLPLTRAEDGTQYAGVYSTVFLIPTQEIADLLARPHNANRVICRINDTVEIHAGLMPDGKGDYFMTVNKQLCQKCGLEIGDMVKLEVRPDDSDYGMPLPPEVAELWELDPEAREVFHTLTPGNQRNLLYQIDKLKRPDSRAKKAVQIHDYLKAVNGKLEYRGLNAFIKADNR